MKSFGFAPVALFSLLATTVHATYSCSTKNAVPASSLGGSSSSSSGGSNDPLLQSGCSFGAAAGLRCTTGSKRRGENIEARQTPSNVVIPCLDRMQCLLVERHVYCVDLSNLDYIDDVGACGNLNKGSYVENCAEVKGVSSSGTSTASSSRSSGTASSSRSSGTAAAASKAPSSSASPAQNDASAGMTLGTKVLGFVVGAAAFR